MAVCCNPHDLSLIFAAPSKIKLSIATMKRVLHLKVIRSQLAVPQGHRSLCEVRVQCVIYNLDVTAQWMTRASPNAFVSSPRCYCHIPADKNCTNLPSLLRQLTQWQVLSTGAKVYEDTFSGSFLDFFSQGMCVVLLMTDFFKYV